MTLAATLRARIEGRIADLERFATDQHDLGVLGGLHEALGLLEEAEEDLA